MVKHLVDELRKLRNQAAHGLVGDDLPGKLKELGLAVPEDELPVFQDMLLRLFSDRSGFYYAPPFLLEVMERLLAGRCVDTVCDPWAGFGSVLDVIQTATEAKQSIAFVQEEQSATLGRYLLSSAEWHLGDPLQLLKDEDASFDVVASVLPFGVKVRKAIELKGSDGKTRAYKDELGHLLMLLSTLKLTSNGIGLFVVPVGFFSRKNSIRQHLTELGVGIRAAFAMPPGSFSPFTSIASYLIVTEKAAHTEMFVAQLTSDLQTNIQVLKNYENGEEGATAELGRIVEADSFKNIDAVRSTEKLQKAEKKFGAPAVTLGEISTSVKLGQSRKEFTVPECDNAIYIPVIGVSNVHSALGDTTLKLQNYAQVGIDPKISDARFVAQFLNTELGKEAREMAKTASVIPRLNTDAVNGLRVFIPDLKTQDGLLALDRQILSEENTVLGLLNELSDLRREIWSKPSSMPEVSHQLEELSKRLSKEAKEYTQAKFDQWFETLPFPLASILRAWQATPTDDYKTKYEYLLHFFEASAQFTGIILLSAFRSRDQAFEEIRTILAEALKKQNLSLHRATFGTWKAMIEFLGKRVRKMLSGDRDEKAICADMFADPSQALPAALSSKELKDVFVRTNTKRNDWQGHGGIVSPQEAQRRNDELLQEVFKLRDITAGIWEQVQLVRGMRCHHKKGIFTNEVSILMGSNAEFVKSSIELATCLDEEELYLVGTDSGKILELLPLVQIGPVPESSNNACYFYNRINKDSVRYVTYHFQGTPERLQTIEEAAELIALLEGV